MARVSQVIVLAEDRRQQRLIYKYLQRINLHRVTRFEPVPNHKGSGEQWVRDRYASSVRAFRGRHARTALIVIIDADTGDVSRRSRQLADGLVAEGLPPRADEERIVHLIPKRNIETWILNLNGGQVDEQRDYRHYEGIDEQIGTAAEVAFEWTRPNAPIPDDCVLSLRLAIVEIRRLELQE